MTRRGAARSLLLLAAASCAGTGLPGPAYLAQEPPLPYSVLLTGGAFLEPDPPGEEPPPLGRTYRPARPTDEAFLLADAERVLEQGRVFVRVERDETPAEGRIGLTSSSGRQSSLARVLERARSGGHDLVLVLEGITDGPIEARGINGQWPITVSVWLMIGLGLVIPDHTYEPQASLAITVREPETGRVLDDRTLKGAPVDLSLVERTGALGLATSIIVPPTLVASDPGSVEETVRDVASQRLLLEMARVLKSVDVRDKLRRGMPARIDVEHAAEEVLVRVTTTEAVAGVEIRSRDEALAEGVARRFEEELLQSAEDTEGGLVYRCRLPRRALGDTVQILVQTVTGRIASTTVPLPR